MDVGGESYLGLLDGDKSDSGPGEVEGGFRALGSLLSRTRDIRTVERCDLCRTEINDDHRHLADLESREILCACKACSLLFYGKGAAGGRYRLIPDRVIDLRPSSNWRQIFDSLDIPVSIVFFFNNSKQDNFVGLYPGPAGATECQLSVQGWQRLVMEDERIRDIEPDVEAILIRSSDEFLDAFLVPLDLCYQLVGSIRKLWRGFDGGSEARSSIEEFFETLRSRALRDKDIENARS